MPSKRLVRSVVAIATVLSVTSAVAGVTDTATAKTTSNVVHPKIQRAKPVRGGPNARTITPGRTTPKAAVPTRVALPTATAVTGKLPTTGTWTRLGSSGLAMAYNSGAQPTVRVEILTAPETAELHLSGVVLRVTRTDHSAATSKIALSIPNSLLTGAYGAQFASNADWLQLTGCGTTTCAASHSLSSRRISVGQSSTPTLTGTRVTTGAQATPSTANAMVTTISTTTTSMLLTPAAVANSSQGAGDSSASPLSPASQWTASPQTGDFSWSDPLRTPPPAAGPTPTLAISYDSNSINGQTGATDNQPSQVGEGFDLTGGGSIARSYANCSDVGIANSGDRCWKDDNAVLTLAGHSNALVRDSSGNWKLANDDNTKIEHLVNNTTLCSNGTTDNDCWRLTTTDGTQYYFGRDKLPGWATGKTLTNSAWTMPVCGTATTACSGTATTATPFSTQAWQWNLDYVVDTHGNSEAFYYTAETNRYAEKASTTASVTYIRGGYLTRIDYGMHAGYELTANAPEQVTFTESVRCETGVSGEPAAACTTTPPTTANATYWPDVPWNDFNCTTTACSGKTSPTFWSAERLSSITTQYLSGSSYVPVDTWSLTHSWPDPGDTTAASMTLTSITHAGDVGTAISLPATTFSYGMKPNRVAPPNGIVPLEKPRLNEIDTEQGARITVNYLDTDCSGSSPATAETNTKRCYPQYWAPPGGTLALDWFRIYPVASVISDPHTGGLVDHPDQTFYDYSLGAPAYRLDTSPLTTNGHRTWSDFAGFSEVRVEHGDPNDPTTLQTTDNTYFQGMNGDIANSTGAVRPSTPLHASDGTTATDSPWLSGRTFETRTYNGLGGALVSDEVDLPWSSNPTLNGVATSEKVGTSGSTFIYTPTARHLGEGTTRTSAPLSTSGRRVTQTENTYDTLGRVTATQDDGDTTTSSDDRCTTTSYDDNTSTNILDLPLEVDSYAGSCTAAPSDPATATISDVRTSYDTHTLGATPTVGDATKTEKVTSYTGSTPAWTTESSTTYDALGRPLTATDGMSRVTRTAYTPAAPAAGAMVSTDIGPATSVVVTDPMGFTTTDALSPAWGSTTSETDPNTHMTTTAYDALGRLTGTWQPDRLKASNTTPSTGYSYTVTAGQPLAIATTTLTPTGGTQTSYQLYDGLGRLRQTQAPAEAATYNATPGTGGSSVTEITYDFAGQAVMTYGPYLIASAPSSNIFTPTAYGNIASATGAIFDGAGRTTADVTYAYGAEQWRTTTAYPGVDRTDVTPPEGATPTTIYTDAFGDKTSLLQWHGASIGDVTDTSQYDTTSYTYFPTGRMHTMTNAGGENWNWTYNPSGQVVTATDPDMGTTATTYDADDEVQSTTDAANTTLWYSYDADGRKTALRQDSGTGPLLDTWEYDQLTGEKGLLDSSSSYNGTATYTTAVTGYDADNRPLSTTTTLPAGTLGAGSSAYNYSTSATYNADGSLATQAEPAAGGVPAETLRYTYTSLGRLYSLLGAKQYLTQTGYDAATNLIVGEQRSNGINSLNDGFTYTPGTTRLAEDQVTTSSSSNNLVADRHYAYDDAGQMTSVSDTASGGQTDTQCFQYDYLQRLTQEWTPSATSCSASPSSSALGGPAATWQSFTYDPSGNRTTTTQHATTPDGTDQRDTYNYPTGPGVSQANAVQSITHASASAGSTDYTTTATDTYSYDLDGRTTARPGSVLTWTSQSQLQTVSQVGSGNTQSRIYDANGELLVQTDPVAGTTVYLGDTELQVAAGSSTITGQRIYSVNGDAVAVRNGASTLAWLDADPQGTSELTESFTTGATTIRYFDAFGGNRGATVAWPEDRGFLNKPTDAFSGLTTLGVRQYDPTTGRFLSVDPLLDVGSPQQANGYSYANNDPNNRSDPTGLIPMEGGGGYCSSSAKCTSGTDDGRSVANSGGNEAEAAAGDTLERTVSSPPPPLAKVKLKAPTKHSSTTLHNILHKTSQIANGASVGALGLAFACTYSVVAIPLCDAPTVGFSIFAGDVSAVADLTDMFTGGKEWNTKDVLLDGASLLLPGSSILFKTAPAAIRDFADVTSNATSLGVGVYNALTGGGATYIKSGLKAFGI